MTTPQTHTDPASPALLHSAKRSIWCDPTPRAMRRITAAPKMRWEHFMNKMKETAMWRETDLSKPAPHHTARDRVEPRSNRPRVSTGQRLAQALFDRAGPLARLVRHGETQWSSATFSGSRHTFVLGFEGIEALSAAELLVIAIGDDAITVPRALIAEMTVTRFTQTLLPQPEAEIEISALLLDQ